jgi:hypothetical protein
MRAVTTVEREIVRWFAARANELQRERVLSDLDQAQAEETRDKHLTIQFQVEGYTRLPYRVEHPLLVNACVLDFDGAKLDVSVSLDENDRLFQLQVLRFEDGPVQGPDWTTLRELSPGEIVYLGSIKISSVQLVFWRVRRLMGRLTGRIWTPPSSS